MKLFGRAIRLFRKKPDGTIDNPFTTLQDGLDSASDGSDGKPGKVIYVNNPDGRFISVEEITDPAILRAWRPRNYPGEGDPK